MGWELTLDLSPRPTQERGRGRGGCSGGLPTPPQLAAERATEIHNSSELMALSLITLALDGVTTEYVLSPPFPLPTPAV